MTQSVCVVLQVDAASSVAADEAACCCCWRWNSTSCDGAVSPRYLYMDSVSTAWKKLS